MNFNTTHKKQDRETEISLSCIVLLCCIATIYAKGDLCVLDTIHDRRSIHVPWRNLINYNVDRIFANIYGNVAVFVSYGLCLYAVDIAVNCFDNGCTFAANS